MQVLDMAGRWMAVIVNHMISKFQRTTSDGWTCGRVKISIVVELVRCPGTGNDYYYEGRWFDSPRLYFIFIFYFLFHFFIAYCKIQLAGYLI